MSAKDWFGVAARVLGLWTVIEALRGFVMAWGYQQGWFDPPDLTEYYLANSVMELAAGVLLLRGVGVLVQFCFPENPASRQDGSV